MSAFYGIRVASLDHVRDANHHQLFEGSFNCHPLVLRRLLNFSEIDFQFHRIEQFLTHRVRVQWWTGKDKTYQSRLSCSRSCSHRHVEGTAAQPTTLLYVEIVATNGKVGYIDFVNAAEDDNHQGADAIVDWLLFFGFLC